MMRMIVKTLTVTVTVDCSLESRERLITDFSIFMGTQRASEGHESFFGSSRGRDFTWVELVTAIKECLDLL